MLIFNIPRRKIYEELLILEEGVLELKRMFFKKELFEQFKEEFFSSFSKIKESYFNIKILLVFFLENKIFKDEEEFLKEQKRYISEPKLILVTLRKYKILNKRFFKISDLVEKNILQIEEQILNDENLKTIDFNETNKLIKEFVKVIDSFDDVIPKILEIPRKEINLCK